MLFFAVSIPLRIASGTSLALPSPKPTRPFWSPTTTSALKLKRRPPFTTLATRLMCTTFSFSSTPRSSTIRRWPGPPICAIACASSELEAAFARALGDGAHAAVVQESVAVEDDARDALLLAPARDELPDLLRRGDGGGLRELRAQLRRQRRHGEDGVPGGVGRHLGVHVLAAAKDRQPRAVVGAAHPAAHPVAPTLAGEMVL